MVQTSGEHQLRLVVYHIVYKVLYLRWLFGISEPSAVPPTENEECFYPERDFGFRMVFQTTPFF